MLPGESTPPPTPPPLSPGAGRRALISLGLLLGLLLVARTVIHHQLPIPACPLRSLTSLPCPFCGSTRALAALAGGDPATALALNPFVTLATLLAAGALAFSGLGGAKTLARWRQRLSAQAFPKWLLVLALLLNWLYLWRHLPR